MLDEKSELARLGRSIGIKVAVVGLAMLVLYWTSHHHYLLFHTLVELFSIAIGWSVLALVWNARQWMKNPYLFVLGVSLAAVGCIDLAHALAYRGLSLFPGYDTDLPTQLWIAARYLQSLSMLFALLLLTTRRGARWLEHEKTRSIFEDGVLIGYVLLTALLLVLIFYRRFPTCYIERQGLTPFKKVSEYLISLILAVSLAVLWQKRRHFDPTMLWLLMAATVATILSELAFTFYLDVYDLSNLIGHYGKLLAFFLIYVAVIEVGLRRPYGLLFQDLRRREALFKGLSDNSFDIMNILTADATIVYESYATRRILGYEAGGRVGQNALELVHPQDREPILQVFQQLVATPGGSALVEFRFRHQDGSWRWLESSGQNFLHDPDLRGILINSRDVTARKQTEDALRQSVERLHIQHEIDTAILSAYTLEEIAAAVLPRLQAITGCCRASIGEIDADLQHGRDLIVVSGDQIVQSSEWHPLTRAGDFWVTLEQGQVYMVPDLAVLPSLSRVEQVMLEQGLRFWVAVPLIVQGVLIGSLNLADPTPQVFQPAYIEMLREIANPLSIALQQRRLWQQTQADAEIKARLLGEINHRVGNNLTLLLALIESAMWEATSPETQDVLQDLHSRVQSMSEVHRLLSQAEWTPLDLALLADQVIGGVLGISSRHHCIDYVVRCTGPAVCVTARQAFRLALVLNELITNSLKYAFYGREQGRIEVDIAAKDGQARLVLHDDGPGWPDDVLSGRRKSVGLNLIYALVQGEMRGEVLLRNDGGAVAECCFAVEQGGRG